MRLEIKQLEDFDRPWLLKRSDGTYSQHAHFKTKKDAKRVKNLIEINKYPIKREDKYAMQRILTEEEFKSLDKKQRYYNPCLKAFYRLKRDSFI